MSSIRVLIADDSMLTRVILKDLLSRDAGIEVVGEASDGRSAVEAVGRLRPNLVIMDVMMPVMDGIDAVIEIMARFPTPILMLSANTDPNDKRGAFEAIRLGALDVMQKPQGVMTEAFEEIGDRLVERIKELSRIRVMHHFRPGRKSPAQAPAFIPVGGKGERRILAIGASTGGPKVVMKLMKELPPGLDVRILIVQHIASGFEGGFAEWLDRESPYDVRLAREGEALERGVALLAPCGRHMEVRDGRIALTDGPMVNCCRPAVDALFHSLAGEKTAPLVAATLLTGMGRDGADGMRALRDQGAYTIAQDEETSAVYGMPRAAVEIGAACEVLPIQDIPASIARHFSR